MSNISFMQLFILLLPFVAAYIFVRRMRRDGPRDLIRPLRSLNTSFWTWLCSTVILFGVALSIPDLDSPLDQPVAFTIFCILMFTVWISGLTLLGALGVLAKRQGKSPIVWAGMPIIFPIIGPIVAYATMRQRTKASIDDIGRGTKSDNQ